MTVVSLGGLNINMVLQTPVIAAPGQTREGTAFYATPGGKGANQAVAAARFLAGRRDVEMVGLIGDDHYGVEMRDFLASQGLGVMGVRQRTGVHSGVAIILVDGNGENSVNAVYGSNALCGEEQVADVGALFDVAPRGGRVLLVQQEVAPLETTAAAMRAARERDAAIILDPAPTRPDFEHLLPLADIVTPNAGEAADFAGFPVHDAETAHAAAQHWRAWGAPCVAITLGPAGVWIEDDSRGLHLPAPKVTPVATVGAGDAFNGVLAGGLALGHSLEEAARVAVVASALSVTKPGAQESMPTRAEVEAMLASLEPRS